MPGIFDSNSFQERKVIQLVRNKIKYNKFIHPGKVKKSSPRAGDVTRWFRELVDLAGLGF